MLSLKIIDNSVSSIMVGLSENSFDNLTLCNSICELMLN